jgi:SNF2 family DNA or RNA helicase
MCNNVILLDLWWNPAIEEQAVNRVHRIGQDKQVHIYKLTVPDTVEDKILKVRCFQVLKGFDADMNAFDSFRTRNGRWRTKYLSQWMNYQRSFSRDYGA